MVEKCKCRMDMLVLALILVTIGFSCLIQGIVIQFSEDAMVAWWKFGVSYFVGFVFMVLAKMAKHKSFEKCTLHKRK